MISKTTKSVHILLKEDYEVSIQILNLNAAHVVYPGL